MSAPITLTVPMPDPVTNASGGSRHWRTVHSRKRAYWGALDVIQATGGRVRETQYVLPEPPDSPLDRATVRATLYLGNAMDDDNAIARCKPVLDWLVRRGYLKDDRRSCLRWESLPEQVVKRGQQYRIELTLTPLPLP